MVQIRYKRLLEFRLTWLERVFERRETRKKKTVTVCSEEYEQRAKPCWDGRPNRRWTGVIESDMRSVRVSLSDVMAERIKYKLRITVADPEWLGEIRGEREIVSLRCRLIRVCSTNKILTCRDDFKRFFSRWYE